MIYENILNLSQGRRVLRFYLNKSNLLILFVNISIFSFQVNVIYRLVQ
jgi:hypothetical protein